jgi:hypothetical protein
LLYLIADRPELAQHAIPGVDAETQEFWTALLWGLSNYFDEEATPDPADRAAETMKQLASAQRRLEPSARLELLQLEFCDKIDGFGNYHRFETPAFRPGQPVLLYAEIRNFTSQLTAAGMHRTALRSSIELLQHNVDGPLVDRTEFESTEDLCRSPRRDYFHSYRLELPEHLAPGPYTARLSVEDELGGKIGSATINLRIE